MGDLPNERQITSIGSISLWFIKFMAFPQVLTTFSKYNLLVFEPVLLEDSIHAIRRNCIQNGTLSVA